MSGCAKSGGRLTSITHTYPTGHPYAGTLTAGYTYDARGRLLTESLQLPGLTPTLTVTYQYDTDGHLTQLTYPSGRVVNYSYGPLGRIVTLATTAPGAAAQTVASAIAYRAFGRVAGWTWGNSQTHSFTFDTENRLLTYPRGASAIELGYDPNSNVSSRTDSSAPTQAESFNYDTLDRLTGQTDSATSRGWAYDAVGNRTSSTVGAATTSYTYSATSNRLTQIGTTPPATVVTDANGAVTDDGVNQYTYDARGRLTGATTAAGSITYLVGPRGRRLAKTTSAGTTYYVYDSAGHLIAELDSTGAPVQEHIWLNDTPLAMAQSTTLYYVDTDQLNTPRALLNSTGTVVWRWTGQAFGDSPADEDPDADSVNIAYNLRFPGQYYDRETGTFYNGARDYDPAIGRYLQSDPAGLAGGVNTYAYVNGNPLGFVDPYGLWRLGEPLPQGVVDYSAGIGDNVSLGLTAWLRDLVGINGGVNKCSLAYEAGGWTGTAVAAATGFGAASARAAIEGATSALSEIRYTQAGEKFIRYESENPAFSRITSTGGVTPGTYAAPVSDGLVSIGERASTYNLPSPEIPRPNAIALEPPAGTAIIGPRSVVGGVGNEVIFPFGF